MGKTLKAFDEAAGSYDDWYSHPQGRQVFEAELRAVESLLPSGGVGLEVGAGTGIFAEHITREGRTVVCLDPSTEMLARAAGRGVQSVLGTGEKLPFRLSILDFTYLVTVLEFLNDPSETLREIREASKQCSALVLLFINSESSWGELYRQIGAKGDPVFRHASLHTLPEVTEILGSAGYTLQKSVGTLTTGPTELIVGCETKAPGPGTGVIVVKASKKK
ncbi:class I SAM-dependent methyltransferase [Candidatus Bathyarchaeota archaeon]|nr:class I SAM-dependent methyltransferase [Candidatus Bathyarchaeota archaeon]